MTSISKFEYKWTSSRPYENSSIYEGLLATVVYTGGRRLSQ